jgi:hypothetical protein
MALLDTDSAQATDNQNQDKSKGQDNAKAKDQPVETPGWLATIEDKNLQENDTLRRFKNPHALAVSYVELRNKLGANPVSVPEDKAPPEKWDEFYNQLGRPDKPEKYEFTKLEGMEREPEMEQSFRLQAHALGLSQKQADGLNRWVGELAKGKLDTDLKAHNKMVEEAEATLKKEWGNDFQKNLAIANKALHRFGGKAVGEKLKAKGLDGDPDLVRFFHTLGKATMEESELKGLGTGRQPGLKSRAQLEEMMKDPRYWKDSEYRRIVENGFAALYGGQQAQQS